MHQACGSWVLHAARPAPAETRQYRRGGPIVPRDASNTPRCLLVSLHSSQASWRVDTDKGGSTLRCLLKHDGLAVPDCVLEPGDLYLSIPFFPPATVSRKEGLLSIIAYRFGIRKERRLVGVFFAEGPLEDTK